MSEELKPTGGEIDVTPPAVREDPAVKQAEAAKAPTGEPAAKVETAGLSFEKPAAPAPQDAIVEYNPTGDAGLDLALEFIGKLGIGPDREDMKAATQGDFSKLRETLKGLGDKAKGYERYVALAEGVHQRRNADRTASETKTLAAIHESVGGKANWDAIHAWVAQEASEEQKQEITAAFRAGALPAQAMASQLAALYQQSGQSRLPAKSAVKDTAGGVPASSGALSPEEFKSEVRKLYAKYGYGAQNRPEWADIVARRQAHQPR